MTDLAWWLRNFRRTAFRLESWPVYRVQQEADMFAAFRRNMRTMMMRLADATLHCDGRERLSRKAQCKQNDDEEFAPVVHGAGV